MLLLEQSYLLFVFVLLQLGPLHITLISLQFIREGRYLRAQPGVVRSVLSGEGHVLRLQLVEFLLETLVLLLFAPELPLGVPQGILEVL